MCFYFRSLFFFQAEDGIRDIGVTGVQTCALPISSRRSSPPCGWRRAARRPRRACVRSDGPTAPVHRRSARAAPGFRRDRKSVVKGKSVDLGGRRIITKENVVTAEETRVRTENRAL